eukprot:1159542-Pelagomonas_calceolata.AAC.8
MATAFLSGPGPGPVLCFVLFVFSLLALFTVTTCKPFLATKDHHNPPPPHTFATSTCVFMTSIFRSSRHGVQAKPLPQRSFASSLAPGYMPLSSVAMARLVAEMRAVYRAAAMEQVAEARRDHKEVRAGLSGRCGMVSSLP